MIYVYVAVTILIYGCLLQRELELYDSLAGRLMTMLFCATAAAVWPFWVTSMGLKWCGDRIARMFQ